MKRWMCCAITPLLILGLTLSAWADAPKPEAPKEEAPAPEAAPAAAPAQPQPVEEEEEPPTTHEVLGGYFGNATRKMLRGASNVLFGWVEIPQRTIREKSFMGFLKSFGDFGMRTGAGIVDLVTFPMPWPYSFQPLVAPEFPGGDWDDPEPTTTHWVGGKEIDPETPEPEAEAPAPEKP